MSSWCELSGDKKKIYGAKLQSIVVKHITNSASIDVIGLAKQVYNDLVSGGREPVRAYVYAANIPLAFYDLISNDEYKDRLLTVASDITKWRNKILESEEYLADIIGLDKEEVIKKEMPPVDTTKIKSKYRVEKPTEISTSTKEALNKERKEKLKQYEIISFQEKIDIINQNLGKMGFAGLIDSPGIIFNFNDREPSTSFLREPIKKEGNNYRIITSRYNVLIDEGMNILATTSTKTGKTYKYKDDEIGSSTIEIGSIPDNFELSETISSLFNENIPYKQNKQKEINAEYDAKIDALGTTQTSTSVKPIVKDLNRWADIKDATTPYTDKGIVVTRISNTNEHFGNPFIGSKRRDKQGNLVESKVDNITIFNTIDEADRAYRDWLIGTKHQNIQPARREWILKQINEGKLDGKTLLYYKPMEVTNNDGTIVKGGYHSHADTLAEIVNELRSTQTSTEDKSNVQEVYQGYDELEDREFNYFTSNQNEAKDYGPNVRQVSLDTTGYLKRSPEDSAQYFKEVAAFKQETGKTFDILLNDEEGLAIQKEFFRFLRDKGYRGLDMLSGTDSKYAVSFYPVETFDEVEEEDELSFEDFELDIENNRYDLDALFTRQELDDVIESIDTLTSGLYDNAKAKQIENYNDLVNRINKEIAGPRNKEGVDLDLFDKQLVLTITSDPKYAQLFQFDEKRIKEFVDNSLAGKVDVKPVSPYSDALLSTVQGMNELYGDIKKIFIDTVARLNAEKETYEGRDLTDDEQAELSNINKKINTLNKVIDNYADDDNYAMAKKGIVPLQRIDSGFLLPNEKKAKLLDVEESSGSDFDKNSQKLSIQQRGTPALDRLLRSIILYDESGKMVYNTLGFPKRVPLNFAYNKLGSLLAGNINLEHKYQILDGIKNEESTIGNISRQILIKLGNTDSLDPDAQSLLSDFNSTFNITDITSRITTSILNVNKFTNGDETDVTMRVSVTSSSNATMADKKVDKLLNQFFTSVEKHPFIKKNADGINSFDYVKFLNKYSVAPEITNAYNRQSRLNKVNNELIFRDLYQYLFDIGIKLTDTPAIRKFLSDYVSFSGTKSKSEIEARRARFTLLTQDLINLVGVKDQKDKPKIKDITSISDLFKLGNGQGALKLLLRHIETKYSGREVSVMTSNADGTVNCRFSDNSSTTNKVNSINYADSIEELGELSGMERFSTDPLLKGNLFLSRIYDEKGVKRPGAKMIIESNSGLALQVVETRTTVNKKGEQITSKPFNKDQMGTSTYSLNTIDKLHMDLEMFVLTGITSTLQPGNKKTNLLFRTDSRASFYIPINSFQDNISKEMNWVNAFHKIAMSQLERELNRALLMRHVESLSQEERNKIPEFARYYNARTASGERLTTAGRDIVILKDMFNEKNLEALFAKMKNDGLIEVNDLYSFLSNTDSELLDKLTTDITDWSTSQSNEFISRSKAKGAGKRNFYSESLIKKVTKNGKFNPDTVLRSFWINHYIHNFEISTIFAGDLCQYEHKKNELPKRNGAGNSTKSTPRNDPGYVYYANNNGTYINYINSNATFTGDREKALANSEFTGKYKSAVTDDVLVKSAYYDSLVAHRTAELLKQRPSLGKAALTLALTELKAYKKMSEGDGQGWITLPAYKILCEAIGGRWTKEQTALWEKVLDGTFTDALKVAEYFPILKMQMFGPYAYEGVGIEGFHKFSLMPLIPSLIKDQNLLAMHDRMIEQGIHYTMLKSASKISNIAPEDRKADAFYSNVDPETGIIINREIAFNDPNYQFTENLVSAEYFGLQQVSNSSYKNKATFSTQLKKLAEIGLYENRVPTDYKPEIKGKDREKLRIEWHSLSEKEKEKSANYRLSQLYKKTLTRLVNKLRDELLDEFGLDKDYKPLKNTNNELLFARLRASLSDKDYAEYEISAIQNGKDLSSIPNPEAIEKIIQSIISKRIIQPKLNGEASILASITGQEPRNATEAENAKYGTNDLAFYTEIKDPSGKVIGINAMKVKIALSGKFTKLLKHKAVLDLVAKNKNMTPLQALNILIRDEAELDKGNLRQMITMVGVRIPVQGPNSMEVMEVFEFLPEGAGNMIITPSEIVAKSGGDFDIDKLTILMPGIEESGDSVDLVKDDPSVKETKTELNKALKKIKKDVERETLKFNDWLDRVKDKESATAKKKTEEYNALMEAYKSEEAEIYRKKRTSGYLGVQNDLMGILKDILLRPSNYSALYLPNGTYTLQPISDDPDTGLYKNRDYRPGKSYRYDLKDGVIATTTLTWDFNEDVRLVNNEGGIALAIGATENVINVAFNKVGMYVEPILVSSSGKTSWDNNMLLNHNTVSIPRKFKGKDEIQAISLGSLYDSKEENNIADMISQAMNGWLDITKNDWINDLQGNKLVTPILLFMIQAGVPVKEAVYFAAQPIIIDYFKRKRELGLRSDLQNTDTTTKFWEHTSAARYKMYNDPKLRMMFNARDPGNYNSDITSENINWRIRDLQQEVSDAYGDSKPWSQDYLYDKIENKSSKYTQEDVDMLLHFMKIEDMATGIAKIKGNLKFDTGYNANFYDVIVSQANLDKLYSSKYVNANMIRSLLSETVQGVYNIEDFTIKAFGEHLMPFRTMKALRDTISDYLQDKQKLANTDPYVDANEGTGDISNYTIIEENTYYSDQEEAYTTFINNFAPFLFQNILTTVGIGEDSYVNYSIDDKNNAVKTTIPIENNKYVKLGAILKDDKVYYNRTSLENIFFKQAFIKGSKDVAKLNKSTEVVGVELAPVENNRYFIDSEHYIRFVIEREILRSKYSSPETYTKMPEYMFILDDLLLQNSTLITPEPVDTVKKKAYEEFIRNKALFDTYNFEYMFNSKNAFAITYDNIANIINNTKQDTYESMKYTIFDNLTKKTVYIDNVPTYLLGWDNTQLDKNQYKDYHKQLMDLQNSSVIKVSDPYMNEYISDFFKHFAVYAYIISGQNPVGTYALGRLVADNPMVPALLNPILDKLNKAQKERPDRVKAVIRRYSNRFMEISDKRNIKNKYSMKDFRLRNTNDIAALLGKKPRVTNLNRIANDADSFTMDNAAKPKLTLLEVQSWAKALPSRTMVVFDDTATKYKGGTYNDNPKDVSTRLGSNEIKSTSRLKNVFGLVGRRGLVSGKAEIFNLKNETAYEAYKKIIDDNINSLHEFIHSGYNLLWSQSGYGQELLTPQKIAVTSKIVPVTKTEHGNVVIVEKNTYQKVEKGVSFSALTDNDKRKTHFGNPFVSSKKTETGTSKVSEAEAVQMYKEWLTTDKYNDVEPERRKWILDQIASGKLKGQTILYYKELNRPSHANVLDELINGVKSVYEPYVDNTDTAIKEVPMYNRRAFNYLSSRLMTEFGYQNKNYNLEGLTKEDIFNFTPVSLLDTIELVNKINEKCD